MSEISDPVPLSDSEVSSPFLLESLHGTGSGELHPLTNFLKTTLGQAPLAIVPASPTCGSILL